MKSSPTRRQPIVSSAVGRDGYVRVTPTWGTSQIHQMDAGGFGRYIGWLLGAMLTALALVLTNDGLSFWLLLVGIIVGSIVGAFIGHLLARAVWRRVKKSVTASNPRPVRGADVTIGDWMMSRNDGTDRALQIQSMPESTPDPEAALHAEPVPHVRFMTSTRRYVTVPADHTVTIVDLASDVELPTGVREARSAHNNQ
ncbi:MAG: hypothetical protein ACK5MR_11495 [Cumulibacter sp.]